MFCPTSFFSVFFQYQSFARIGRQFQSLKRQVYAVWTSVSFPLCQRSCLIWRIMTNTLTNIDVVIFLSASFFGRSYHSRYQNFEYGYLDQNRHKTTSIDVDIFLKGHRLTGNVIHELNTLNLLECSLYCIRKPSECKSINYRATKRLDYSINCQLINATKTTHPQNLLPDENYDYYEPILEKVFLIIDFSLTSKKLLAMRQKFFACFLTK